jgi:hypothetical protein
MRSKPRSIAVLVAATTAALSATVVTAQQASAANLLLAPGNAYTVNTTTLKLTGPSVNVTGQNVGGIAVFKFGTISIPNTASIVAKGSRPLEFLAVNSLILGGVIDVSGANAVRGDLTTGTGGAGGGGGGKRTDDVTAAHGGGPGGGGPGTVDHNNGGGGGGFGGRGARGGTCNSGVDCPGESGTGGTAGPAYGNLNVALQGGSGGGPGAVDARGGGGGGAVALVGASVVVQSTGVIAANGGAGDTGGGGASGGGSGGGVIVHGNSVTIDGVIVANGGAGGAGGCCGDGGGGGGGRIAVQYKSFSSHGLLIVETIGGSSGTHSSGAYTHGGLSPDANGSNGLITFTRIDASVLTIGKSKTVKKGTAVTIATRLTDLATGRGIGHAKVTLYKRFSKTGPWSKVTTKTTSSTGTAGALVAANRFTQYQWRFAGDWVHDPSRSPIQSISIAS